VRVIAALDCGTTNSRLSLVDGDGRVVHRGAVKAGVRDTAIRGSNAFLKAELLRLLDETLTAAGVSRASVDFVISSGMITSELGIRELPHLFAPVSMKDLAGSITRIDPEESFDPEVPLYLIRGVKNPYDPGANDVSRVGDLDFMRGEETQVAGLLELHGGGIPTTMINLSSHSKFIPVDGAGRILGSLTTLSGQVFEALVKETFIGKSVAPGDGSPWDAEVPFHRETADLAYDIVGEAGLLRAFMMPRFMDVLLKTDWKRRRAFVESALAADDLATLRLFPRFGYPYGERIFLVGPAARCEIFHHYLTDKLGLASEILVVSDPEEVLRLAVLGALHLAARAGLR